MIDRLEVALTAMTFVVLVLFFLGTFGIIKVPIIVEGVAVVILGVLSTAMIIRTTKEAERYESYHRS